MIEICPALFILLFEKLRFSDNARKTFSVNILPEQLFYSASSGDYSSDQTFCFLSSRKTVPLWKSVANLKYRPSNSRYFHQSTKKKR